MKGNPNCIYSMLHGWPGGYSVDYASVKHVHISYVHDGRSGAHVSCSGCIGTGMRIKLIDMSA